jgi:hypothetical protein
VLDEELAFAHLGEHLCIDLVHVVGGRQRRQDDLGPARDRCG